MEKIEITKDILKDLYVNQLSNKNLHSRVKPLFDLESGEFNPSNWNSGQDILRTILLGIWDNMGGRSILPYEDHQIHIIMNFYEDTWMTSIIDYNSTPENSDYYSLYGSKIASYSISWYKHRGCTDNILYNGNRINIDQYIELVNLLLQKNDLYKYSGLKEIMNDD